MLVVRTYLLLSKVSILNLARRVRPERCCICLFLCDGNLAVIDGRFAVFRVCLSLKNIRIGRGTFTFRHDCEISRGRSEVWKRARLGEEFRETRSCRWSLLKGMPSRSLLTAALSIDLHLVHTNGESFHKLRKCRSEHRWRVQRYQRSVRDEGYISCMMR